MRRLFYAVAALSLLAVSCGKDDEIMDKVDVPDRGLIRYINRSMDQYDFYLDDTKMGNMYGGDTIRIPNVTAGTHQVKAIQTSNLIGAATQRQQVVIVYKDSVSTFIYP